MYVLLRALFLLCFWIGLYFLPTIIAYRRRGRAGPGAIPAQKIFLVNLIFGWTIFGWFVAMRMAIEELTLPQPGQAVGGGQALAGAPQDSWSPTQSSQPCGRCGGSGTEMCSSCQGRGSWYTQPQSATDSAQLVTCPACVSSGRLRCMGCGGSGRAQY
jgi:hypothetical protein